MEHVKNKLNSGNPMVISQVVSKLVQIIKTKSDQDILELPEFKFLKDKSVSHDNAVNIVAAEGILSTVRSGDQSFIKSVITDFVSVITTTKCSSNVAYLINNLLIIDLQKEVAESGCYKCGFNLRLPQHPLLILLSEDPSCWSAVYKEIVFAYKTANKSDIPHYDTLYKPVFLYTLCGPLGRDFLAFQQKLWTFGVQKEAVYDSNNFIECLLSWMQFENRDTIHVNSDFLIELATVNKCKRIFDSSLLVLWHTSVLHQLITNNNDPRDVIFSLLNSLEDINEIVLNPVLFILAKCISSCSSVYLLYLLKLCKVVISAAKCDVITGNILKSALLQWITNSSDLVSDAVVYANNLFSLLQNKESELRQKGFVVFRKKFRPLLTTNTEVYFSVQIYCLVESWKSESDTLNWLAKLETAPTFFVVKIIDFLIGLFLTEFEDKTINMKVFEHIQRCVDHNKMLASNVLTVVLFKLTTVTDTKLPFLLLKALPSMAVSKNNFQKVVSTIQALNRGAGTLKTFSTSLMLELWKIDNKCYIYLESFLIEPYSRGNRWEFFVTKAHVLKELCAMKPELYGKEIVAHLSKILNECNNADGAVPSALAMDGITLLCKSEIIDAVTTWATLSPMFKTELRIPVIRSLCALISEIPSLSYSEAYPQLTEEVVATLWQYLVLHYNDEVWTAALDALSHFSVDQILAQMPENYLDEEILNVRKSGQAVPGHCWIHFMKNCGESKLKIVGDFLIKLMSLEISSYLKFVYQVKGTREPVDYSYLPTNSVVRGVSTYIKSKVIKWKSSLYKEVYLQCLRIFSQEYSKPLPPLDWCFLQELFHEPEAKKFCINMAAHQVMLSGTARRFIVNYIEAVVEDHTEEDVLLIYRNLKHLANSVQPFTIKPFFDVTILSAVDLYKAGQEQFLRDIFMYVKETLKEPDIQEANKIVIAQIISDVSNDVDISSKLFEELLECVVLFPSKCVDDMSSPKCVKEVRHDWFKKAIRIRCCLALKTGKSPLNFLNDLMESGSAFASLQPFLFEQFAAVFTTYKDTTDCVLWVLELIGQIQAATAEKSEQKEVLFLCNIFILATIFFSGHGVFLENFTNPGAMYKLFPRAIATLLDVNHWSICTTQALEWFHYMTTEHLFNKEYKNMFVECLQALRHETEFYKNMKWTKYLNVEC